MLNFLNRPNRVVTEPSIVKFLTTDARASVLWVVLRVWLGLQWFNAGIHKLDSAGWMETGDTLKGYWERAVLIPETGRPAIAFDWYRSFLQFLLDTESYTWFSKLVVYGEILIGVALIIGAFVGIAAFFGAFMNWNFIMAGSASTNPMLLVTAIALILAWKVAGYIGLDFFLLPFLGTPWKSEIVEEVPAPPKRVTAV